MRKKGQIQNMETIAVVIIIIILIVIGIVYASGQKRDSLLREREKTKDLEAMEIATNTLSLDFVKCTEKEAQLGACMDYYKIKALSNKLFLDENYMHFARIFKDSNIEIKIMKNLTSSIDENENITIFTIPNTENKTRMMIKSPIIVKDSVRNLNYFAIMEVTVFR